MIRELMILDNFYSIDTNNIITDKRGWKYCVSTFNNKKLLIHVNALLFSVGDHVKLNVNGILEGTFMIETHKITYQKIYNGFREIYLLLLIPQKEIITYIDSYSYAFIDKVSVREKKIKILLAE